jgi:hypothetical protein
LGVVVIVVVVVVVVDTYSKVTQQKENLHDAVRGAKRTVAAPAAAPAAQEVGERECRRYLAVVEELLGCGRKAAELAKGQNWTSR